MNCWCSKLKIINSSYNLKSEIRTCKSTIFKVSLLDNTNILQPESESFTKCLREHPLLIDT